MKNLPQRMSLVSQTAGILRDQINAGAWAGALPGERELCTQLHVSRPTLRAALELLRREGWIDVSHGRRRQIRKNPKRSRLLVSKCVVILTPVPLHRMPPFVICWMDELRM